MAKAHIPEGVRLEEAAAELAKLGITLGQRLTDGIYRVYDFFFAKWLASVY